VAAKVGVPRPAARRFLLTLVDLGYARKTGKAFELTSKIMDLGFSYLSTLDVSQSSQPYLQALAKKVGATCSVVVLDDTEIVYVARAFVEQVIPSPITLGSRLPAYATAGGRVLLAGLPEPSRKTILQRSKPTGFTPHTVTELPKLMKLLARVEEEGYALVSEELSAGLRSIAVPVRNRGGATVAALSMSGRVWNDTKEALVTRHLPALKATAQSLANHLG
jgi:IclR family pca regulon transcriptional regulator